MVLSNGHGEDVIACQILDALRPGLPADVQLAVWPMVGDGAAYHARGLAPQGPSLRLPSEGFGTLSAGAFWRDLRAGWLGAYARQAAYARRVRADYLLGVGDIVPLAAAALSGVRMGFVACAKSSWYGGRDAAKGGHGGVERALMRRVCTDVFPRDSLTAQALAAQGLPARDFGNPMMDGLDPPDGPALVDAGATGVAVLPGSRGDATENGLFLLNSFLRFDALGVENRVEFLFAVTSASDVARLMQAPGWQPEGASTLRAPNGARARFVAGQFARVLHDSTLAVGLAGTANEQAIGLGLPLITTHGSGGQGAAFLRMKMRYFGPSALAVPRDPAALAGALAALLADPARRATMGAEGRKRMGPAGASARIAAQILARLGEIP